MLNIDEISDRIRSAGFVVEVESEIVQMAQGARAEYLEDDRPVGVVVMFDGGIRHGVEDVDSDQVLDFNLGSGRIAGFVNLYQVLN